MADAVDLEECWSRVLAGSREFGFQGVRMSVNGKVFEDLGSRRTKQLWQLRIPLIGAHYINFFRDFDTEVNPFILSAFVDCVQRSLALKVRGLETEVIRMPAANGLAYAAGAGAGKRVAR